MFLVTVIFLIEFIFFVFFFFVFVHKRTEDVIRRTLLYLNFWHFIEQLSRHWCIVDPCSISGLKGVFIWSYLELNWENLLQKTKQNKIGKKKKTVYLQCTRWLQVVKILPFCHPSLDYQITKQQINGKQLIFRENNSEVLLCT